MIRDEIEKLKNGCEKIIKLTESLLNNKYYDFKNIGLNEIFLNILLKEFVDKVQEEKDRQELVLYDAKRHIQSRYSDCYIIDYVCKLVSYENYYLVKIFGSPFEKVELVYSKNGDLLTCISKFVGCIDAVDNKNFFVYEKNANIAVHQRLDYYGAKWEDINHLSNVCSNILPVFGKNLDVEYGNLVGWTSVRNDDIELEKRVLYNYTKCCIVVPEYTDAKYDYGCFDNMVDRDDLIRIINLLSYDNHVCKLEFLINGDGELCTNVFDFDRDICYCVNQDGRSQLDILNFIYEEAMNYLREESKKKSYSKVRKNNESDF